MAKTPSLKKSKSSFKTVLTKVVDVVKTTFKTTLPAVDSKTSSKKTKTKAKAPAKTKTKAEVPKKPRKPKNAATEVKPMQLDLQSELKPHRAKRRRILGVPDVPFAENASNVSESKFFYSNDKFIDTFEDLTIYDFILAKYKDFVPEQPENAKRNMILLILDDDKFLCKIFSYFDINILDFLKFLFRLCPSVFKGFFIKKVHAIIEGKDYARQIRFAKYTRQRLKASSKKKSSFL